MYIEQLKKQKVAYQILKNALENKTLAHAYLLSGDKGTPKTEMAFLIAQSILCDQSGFACEKCDTCVRVSHQLYSDLQYIDGQTKSIKKQEIIDLQKQFSQTALESKGIKIYIIDGVDNATPDAMNSLLKFLEEPQDNTYAILIAQHSDRILDTIVSRCQNIPFYKQSESLQEELKDDIDVLEARILSTYCANKEQAQEVLESDEFQHALYVLQTFLSQLETFFSASVFLQNEIISKSKRDDKEVWKIFLHSLKLLCKDSYVLESSQFQNIWGKNAEIMVKLKRDKIWQIATQSNDRILRSANVALLVDQFIYEWEDEYGQSI